MGLKGILVRYYNSFGNGDMDWKEEVEQLGRGLRCGGMEMGVWDICQCREMRRFAVYLDCVNGCCACVSCYLWKVWGQVYMV